MKGGQGLGTTWREGSQKAALRWQRGGCSPASGEVAAGGPVGASSHGKAEGRGSPAAPSPQGAEGEEVQRCRECME